MRNIRMALVAAVALLAFVVAGVGVSVEAAKAEQFTFNVKSNYRYKVQIEFYSDNRNHAWPGGNRAYSLNDYDTKSFTINCRAGEKVCYGAWVTGNSNRYWGVGANNRHRCATCCYTCNGGETRTVVLEP